MEVSLASLRHRDVLDIASATVIGRVEGVVLGVEHDRVDALLVGKGPKERPILPWDQIVGIGPDAVTLDGRDRLRPPDGAAEQRAVDGTVDPLERRVLTEDGDLVGHLTDLVFDDGSGALRSVLIDGVAQDAASLRSIGDFAAVVDRP